MEKGKVLELHGIINRLEQTLIEEGNKVYLVSELTEFIKDDIAEIYCNIIKHLEKDGYLGGDVSLHISLFEYGLLVLNNGNGEYNCIFGVTVDLNGIYNCFDCIDITINDIREGFESDKEGIMSYIGAETEPDWDNLAMCDTIYLIQSISNYNGYIKSVMTGGSELYELVDDSYIEDFE